MAHPGNEHPAQRLRHLLERNRALQQVEESDPVFLARLRELQAWQCQRLEHSHADLAAEPRYAAGIAFFIDDLYAPRDFSDRDADIEQALPYMVRLLPERVLATAADAVNLQVLTRQLDGNMVPALFDELRVETIDVPAYAEAYRICDEFEARRKQICLIAKLAERLESYVHSRLLFTTLRMAHGPAHLIGLGDLQSFLERGFRAFRAMRGSSHFVRTVVSREKAFLERIEAGVDNPFPSPSGPE
ncbi:MAG: hypothetical protein EA417_10250 [Gammaproteobacteria bacterium]|nr:MAG: hypothetical protein EA417_10250 [Gammaproteobacteria bacterium]